MDDKNEKLKPIFENMHFIEQFTESVIDYTSRYNFKSNVSYAPDNIIGKPTQYPAYGDFAETYMLRSYGTWWKNSEGSQIEYMPQDKDVFESEDYIILKFEQAVIPIKILVYETFNPGAIVKIWASRKNGFLTLLWKGQPSNLVKNEANVFCPEIKIIPDLVDLIRIEFNQSLLNYHTALDAVLLAGYKPRTPLQANLIRNGLMEVKFAEKKKRRHSQPIENIGDAISLFLTLPHEVIVYIFQFLDLKSLCNCALVNKAFYAATNDSILYRDLCLKRYWNRVCDKTLQIFEPKCKLLRKLDLSWCGTDDKITEDCFLRFLKKCGNHLTHLSLAKCPFVQTRVLESIAKSKELTDLRLRNCAVTPRDSFLVLADLNNLKSLDLYCSEINDQSLIKIIKNNKGLQHLIIDLCEKLQNLDLITETLSIHNKHLRTFSCWKLYSLTSAGIKHLSKCTELRELDLGWCLLLEDSGDCLTHIAHNCPNLRRLILSGWRGLADNQLLPVVRNCHKLEQLDILGTRGITVDFCSIALRNLGHLKLLDVSFCNGVSSNQVENWRQEFPNVVIHRSCEFF